jgi:hypothetical protein
LFFVASTAESLRYGAPWLRVMLWGPAGILVPWLLVPLSPQVAAESVVAVAAAVIAALLALTELNARRVQAQHKGMIDT